MTPLLSHLLLLFFQVMTGLQSRPPAPGDFSFTKYTQERDAIMGSLKRRAVRLRTALATLEGE